MPSPTDGISVRSCYGVLLVLLGVSCGAPLFEQAVKRLWRCNIPHKVHIFSWRLLQGRLATRDLLINLGIIEAENNIVCPYCFQVVETRPFVLQM